MDRKVSKSLRIYATFIIFAILSFSMIATGSLALFLYYWGLLRTTFARPLTLILWLYGVSLFISTVISAVMGKWLLSPILKINRASKQVAKGDFSVRLDADSRIEEVQLTFQNFNNMVKELGAIETLRSDFIANVSHEFKTPLTAIEGYASLLQDEDISEGERREYLDKILLNTGRLSDLAGNILLLSKVENQAIPGDIRRYRLDEQLRQSLLMLEPKWSRKDMELDIELDEISITNCESLLMQVWVNLIGNAIKFSSPGGKLTLRLSRSGEQVLVSIRDEGIGMSSETLQHIFEKFYQGDASRKSEGNGLGLALVRKILDLCSGQIAVTSAPGEGSTFRVYLPCT